MKHESNYLKYRRKLVLGDITPQKKVKKAIPAQSEKMKAETPEYRKFVANFLAKPENKYCNIQLDKNCTHVATCVNHTKGRGKGHKMNEEEVEPSCYYCNGMCEVKDSVARERGHKKSIHKV